MVLKRAHPHAEIIIVGTDLGDVVKVESIVQLHFPVLIDVAVRVVYACGRSMRPRQSSAPAVSHGHWHISVVLTHQLEDLGILDL